MTFPRRIVIRAEGGPVKGMGHIFRCMALAEMLRENYEICFISNYMNPELEEMLILVAHEIKQAKDFQDPETEFFFLQNLLRPGSILVLDGYCFDTPLQQLIKQKGYPLVCIDDIHAFPFSADVVLNHSGGFSVSDYKLESYTKLYTGLHYCLLREPFREAAKVKKTIQLNNNCLVCFGGADPENDTLKTLQKLASSNSEIQWHLVTGNAYQHHDSLLPLKENNKIQFYNNLNAVELCSLMQKCSMAITPPSTTAYEYLSVKGLLFLKTIATNQERMFTYLTGSRLALPLELFGSITNPLSKIDIEALNLIFDGKQQERLAEIFNQL